MRFVYKPVRQRGSGFFSNLFKINLNRRKEREEATAEMERRRKARVISHGYHISPGPFPQRGGGSGFLRRKRGRMGQMQDNWIARRLGKAIQEGGMRPPSKVFGKRQKDRNDELLKNRYRKMGRRTMREFIKHGKVKRTVGRRKRYYDPWTEFTDDFE